jgi:ribosomal protein RSM22 (predicted rRNA methylase)
MLSGILKSILNRQINRLPKRKTSDEKTRYPDDPASMRAFLDTFFTRHYFQVQDSLLEYITSEEFIGLLEIGKLNILDIGSGPVVASLAITEILVCVLKNLTDTKKIKINYFLNDPVNICLGVGKEMLNDYFLSIRQENQNLSNNIVISIKEGFSSNIKQLMRIQRNYGQYDIVSFSYVITPLNEQENLNRIRDGFLRIESLCKPIGKILILQDKFKEALTGKITGTIGKTYKEQELSQYVYSSNNSNETHTYTYFSCLFSPQANCQVGAIAV